jgi:hypothetical protein
LNHLNGIILVERKEDNYQPIRLINQSQKKPITSAM